MYKLFDVKIGAVCVCGRRCCVLDEVFTHFPQVLLRRREWCVQVVLLSFVVGGGNGGFRVRFYRVLRMGVIDLRMLYGSLMRKRFKVKKCLLLASGITANSLTKTGKMRHF